MGALLAGASLASGCARDSLADRAFEAPVDDGAAPPSQDPGASPSDEDPQPGLPDDEVVAPRDDFSAQTESLCDVAGCSFRDKVAIERALEEARISARAERDDTAALAALADAFEGPGFTARDAIGYFDVVDPPDDDLVAQLSRVLSRIHDALDATQRDALAAEIARVGPKEVLGIGRRGFRAAPREREGEGEATGKGGGKARGRGKGPGRAKGDADAGGLRARQLARVDRMCELLVCSDAQRGAIIDHFAQLEREDFDSEIASMNLKLAVLFRADVAPPEAVARQLRALRDMNAGRDRMRAELFARLHALLTPAQRASAAARLRTDPPGRALGLAGRSRD